MTVLALSVAMLTLAACSSSASSSAKPITTTTAGGGQTTTTSASTTTTEPPALPADRPIEVIVPTSYKKGTPAPLLVLLHGYGTTGAVQSAYLRLKPATEAKGMLYVYPDGTKNAIGKRFWNATDACCAGPNSKVDDSAYLSAVIANVKARYDVDPKRVYVVGHSNGGFMSFRMACDHADVVAAIVSIEAATFADPAKCTPLEPVATLQIHGTADLTIWYKGGDNTGAAYPSAMTTLKTWATYNGCDLTPDTPAPAPRSVVQGLPLATVTTFSAGCDQAGHSELWTQPQGTHIPLWSKTFADQIVQFLLDHPKP